MSFLETFHTMFPLSKERIDSLCKVTADNVIQSIEESGIPVQLTRLYENDWDIESAQFEDHDFLAMLSMMDASHIGNLFIVSEACSRYDMPEFQCDVEKLQEFVDGYDIEMLFDGDVIMLAPESQSLTIYHHEGYYCHIAQKT